MSLKIQAAKNIGSGWFGLGVSVAVGFFLSPFILHRLGDEAFGLWILIFSLTGYYGLFDLGIRSSIVKYVAEFVATQDYNRLARTINTAIATYSCSGLVLFTLTVVGSFYAGSLPRVSPAFAPTARLLFLIVGSAIAIGFPLSVFSGILQGLQKFYWLNLTQAVSMVIRALLIVVALVYGGKLLSVVCITLLMSLLPSAFYFVLVHRALPIQYGRRFLDRTTLWRMISFGSTTFIIAVSASLRFQSDALLIGIFLSSAAIAFFSIGAKLVDYSSGFVESMAEIFLPMSSQFHATDDLSRLRKVFAGGNRACALVMFPICATLIILGKSVIEVWVGAKYVSSYRILVLLLVPRTLYRSQAASNRVLFGMNRHRPLALAVLLEGLLNVILSVTFIRYWGIVGDALGSAIPMLGTSLVFLPYYTCRLLRVPVKTFLRQAYLMPLGLCVPLVGALLLLRHLFHAHTYMQLLAQVVAGGSVYGIALFWLFLTKEPIGVRLRTRVTKFLQQAFRR